MQLTIKKIKYSKPSFDKYCYSINIYIYYYGKFIIYYCSYFGTHMGDQLFRRLCWRGTNPYTIGHCYHSSSPSCY